MLVIACSLLMVGFYLMYSTSSKNQPKKATIEKTKTPKNRWVLNSFGLYLLCIGYGIFMNELGIGSGFFTASITLMTFSCLILILAPLNLFKTK